MKRTNPLNLVLLVAIGGAAAWFVELALVSSGRADAVPPITLALALIVIAVAVVVAAIPVRRVAQRKPGARVDPITATRVVLLAKAASITGAILSGAAIGILVFLLTRPVIGVGSTLPAVLATVAAVAVLVGGLIAENMCRIPPDDDDGAELGRRPE